MITQLHSSGSSEPEHQGSQLSLDTLRLDYNNIQYLPPGAFQHFNILNHTFLNGNPLSLVQVTRTLYNKWFYYLLILLEIKEMFLFSLGLILSVLNYK